MKIPLHPTQIVDAMNVANSVIESIISMNIPSERKPYPRKPEQVALIMDLLIEAVAAHEASQTLIRETKGKEIDISVHVFQVGGDKK